MCKAWQKISHSGRNHDTYCTGQLARYLSDPSVTHFAAAEQCYLYLKGTQNYSLVLGTQATSTSTSLVGYADSDGMTTYGNKPIMGYSFTYNDSLISWSSKHGGTQPWRAAENTQFRRERTGTNRVFVAGSKSYKYMGEYLGATTYLRSR